MADSVSAPTLTGERSTLRALGAEDAPSLQRYADNEAVWRNLFDGFPRPYTLADAQGWCTSGCREPSMGHVWGIAVQGEVVGCISVRPDKGWMRCNAEVGYWIGEPFWRRGITSEALQRVTHWAWQNLPEVTRLYAPIFAWNDGSQGVARRCSYVKEGVFPRSAIKAGRVIDRVQWACYRPVLPNTPLTL